MKTIVLFFLIVLLPSLVYPLSRCNQYKQQVRTQTAKVSGLDFPYHYNLGLIEQESQCRSEITSFDNGQGLFQLTPSTGVLKELEKELGCTLNPYKPSDAIKAGCYYVQKKVLYLSRTQLQPFKGQTLTPMAYTARCGLKLANAYQMYNSGLWFLYEASKAGYSCDRGVIRTFCCRGGVFTDTEKLHWLSFCEVSYDYPKQIYRNGEKYKLFDSPTYSFW